MSSVTFLLLAILSSAAMAVALKIFRKQEGNRYAILLGNYLTCVVLAFILMPEKAGFWKAEPVTWICGIATGILFVAGLVGMQSSTRRNGTILTTAFARLGLIVPLAVSVIFFDEKICLLQIVAVVMVLVAFFLVSFDKSAGSEETNDGRIFMPLLVFVFFFCGGADAMSKVFDVKGQRSEDGKFFMILFAMAAILTLALLLYEKGKEKKKVIWKEFAAGMLVGIPNYFSAALLLKSLNGLPAFIVYPCFSAGTLLVVTMIGTLVFKERPGAKAWIGLGLIMIALILLNI